MEGHKKLERMTAARFMAETFKGYGVTRVFFMEAILRKTLLELEELGVPGVLAHSEKAAAYMADGYARVARKIGICMAQSVGAANLASGLQDPYLGLSPVLAITGRKPPVALYRNAYQEIDHRPLFDAVTKYNVPVETADQLPFVLRQAIREAISGAPGPVHLDVVDHVGKTLETAESEFEVIVEEPFTRYPSHRPLCEEKEIEKAARLLEKASSPVIVAGGGATASNAGREIVALAEKLSIPVATSLNGKGTILETHPLSVGIVGSYSRRCANQVVSQADLVLFIGSHTGDQVTNDWKVPKPGTPTIQIDIDPAELGRSYVNSVALLGDAKRVAGCLVEHVDPGKAHANWAKHAHSIVQDWQKEISAARNSDARPIRPERLCREVTDFLPENAILVADTGFSGIWTGTMVYMTHPRQSYIRAAGSLGWGFPASLGAKCACPDRPVVCFAGDGGFWYHLAEMETAVRCGIATVTIVNNNFCLGQDARSVRQAYGDRGNPDALFKFTKVNFSRVAEEMGCFAMRVERPEEIAPALRKALAAGKPAVVEVITDPECRAADPWSP